MIILVPISIPSCNISDYICVETAIGIYAKFKIQMFNLLILLCMLYHIDQYLYGCC